MGFYNESGGGGGAANIPLIKRNNFINGGFQVDQRNAGASQTITAGAAKAYTVDRWYAYATGADITGEQVAGSGQDQFRYQFTGAGENTAIQFGQRIEASHCYFLNGQTVTLSVDLANSLLTTVTWTAYYANTEDTFGTIASPTRTQIDTGTFTVSSTLARYSTQIAIPVAATTGIEIVFSVANQTSGTWTIGAAQLEMGTVATPFEYRSYDEELALGSKYYQEIRPGRIYAQYCTGGGFDTFLSLSIIPYYPMGTDSYSVTMEIISGTFQWIAQGTGFVSADTTAGLTFDTLKNALVFNQTRTAGPLTPTNLTNYQLAAGLLLKLEDEL